MKKRVIFTALSIGTLATSSFVSCSENSSVDPQDIIVNAELVSDHLAFTNANLSTSQGAEYKIRIFGQTQSGDQIITSIKQQTREDEPGNYIKVDENCIIKQLEGEDTTLTLYFRPTIAEDKDVYSVNFSINFQIYRRDKVVAKLSIDNLIFVNGTVTSEDLFKITYTDTDKLVNSFKKDDVTKEQLKLCDVFVLPKGTTQVTDEAFYDGSTHQSTIPPTIKKIYLDYSELDPTYTPLLRKMGKMAFRACTFNNSITLPQPMTLVEDQCFYDAVNVPLVKLLTNQVGLLPQSFYHLSQPPKLDISIYKRATGLPEFWHPNAFGDDRGPEYNRITCYYDRSFNESDWSNYLQEHSIDTSQWTFIAVSGNK